MEVGGWRTEDPEQPAVIYIKIYLSERDMSTFLNISIATLKSALSSTNLLAVRRCGNYCTSCCC